MFCRFCADGCGLNLPAEFRHPAQPLPAEFRRLPVPTTNIHSSPKQNNSLFKNK
jgi:hypothetical protein